MIEFGRTYKDKITGFKGVAIAWCSYSTGCNQALIAPKAPKGGGFNDSRWFDEQRLELVESKDVILLDNGVSPGFDVEAPTR